MADDMDTSVSPQANGTQASSVPDIPSESNPINRPITKRDSYWFAHGGPENVPKTDGKDAQSQKEREERIRQFHAQQEHDRTKKIQELEQSFILSRMYREQQEVERRRRIDEARIKETERRQQVEERKRLIWEAEQERKEAILRRNLEREARIEARRNAQRNSLCFAFGSSTPRTFDLDLAALGRNTTAGCPLMSSVSGKRSDERESLGPKRATSACSLDRKPGTENNDFSMAADISDAAPLWRSVSVEREADNTNVTKLNAIDHMNSERTKACLTMDDSSPSGTGTSFYHNCPSSSRWLVGSGAVVGDDCMSWSMISLSSSNRGRQKTDLVPIISRERSATPHNRSRAKDTSRSPSRPQSSMSARSEVSITSSQASTVSLRPKPAPRKPRPVSIAGSTVDRSMWNSTNVGVLKLRVNEPAAPSLKLTRAKSSEPENPIKNLANLKKPVPPPKSAQVLAKARTQIVPTKDNLRKTVKGPIEPKAVEATASSSDDGKTAVAVQLPQSVSEPVLTSTKPPELAAQEPVAETQVEHQPKNNHIKNKLCNSEAKNAVEITNESVEQTSNGDSNQVKQRITSEEEARAALAEKRRLAREQAERETELERQRQEELQRQEEERKRLEELEQKRLEEEQIKLAELHRKLEEEKLKKAMEEQRLREQEEQERREEEARLKMEKEEQERKAREEAEKQRIELEEKLRKEELERAERKKRVEQIMSRTRGGKGSQSNNNIASSANKEFPAEARQQEVSLSSSSVIVNSNGISDLQMCEPSETVKNGFHSDNVEPSLLKTVNCVPNRTCNIEVTNGYSSHQDTSVTSSPEEKSEKSDSSSSLLLVDLHQSANNVSNGQSVMNPEDKMNRSLNDNFLIDVVNSNIVSSSNPFLNFDDNLSKKQENAYTTDLLS